MKNVKNLSINSFFIGLLFLTVASGCTSDDETSQSLPKVSTTSVTNITELSAMSGGNITAEGGSEVSAKGICWSTIHNPTILDNKTTDGVGSGEFTSALTGLAQGTNYYFRAYATNKEGTAYGPQLLVRTKSLPVTTSTVNEITNNSAICGGSVSTGYDATDITIIMKGICWSTAANPTVANNKTINEAGAGSFISELNNLTPSTTYYCRAYTITNNGITYGNETIFKTSL